MQKIEIANLNDLLECQSQTETLEAKLSDCLSLLLHAKLEVLLAIDRIQSAKPNSYSCFVSWCDSLAFGFDLRELYPHNSLLSHFTLLSMLQKKITDKKEGNLCFLPHLPGTNLYSQCATLKLADQPRVKPLNLEFLFAEDVFNGNSKQTTTT